MPIVQIIKNLICEIMRMQEHDPVSKNFTSYETAQRLLTMCFFRSRYSSIF